MSEPVVLRLLINQDSVALDVNVASASAPAILRLTNRAGVIADADALTVLKGDPGDMPDFATDPLAYYILAKS